LRTLVSPGSRPILIVDWSPLNESRRYFLLRAALPIGGRALPIYEKVHRQEGSPQAQQQLLDLLETFLPEGCRPILVTDAGFRVPWFRAVQAKGWDYVGRIRQNAHYRPEAPAAWLPVDRLYARTSRRPQALGRVALTQRHAFQTTLFLYQRPAQGRRALTATGQVQQPSRSLKNARRAREPWLLASSLPPTSRQAQRVVRLYRLRMQIEEGFRDLKNVRYGFALR